MGHKLNSMRYPRTTQELRENEQSSFARPKRCKNNLPNAYDDIPKGKTGQRSWKNRKQRHQYMGR